eukprot:3984517-Prymnesium_polylepis.1
MSPMTWLSCVRIASIVSEGRSLDSSLDGRSSSSPSSLYSRRAEWIAARRRGTTVSVPGRAAYAARISLPNAVTCASTNKRALHEARLVRKELHERSHSEPSLDCTYTNNAWDMVSAGKATDEGPLEAG